MALHFLNKAKFMSLVFLLFFSSQLWAGNCDKALENADSTESSVATLVKYFSNDPNLSNPKNWKRKRKTKEGNLIVRIFENKINKALAKVTYNPETKTLEVSTADKSFTEPALPRFPKIKPFSEEEGEGEEDEESNLSGKVIWQGFFKGHDESEIYFACAPETTEGYFSDVGAHPQVTETLEELFSDHKLGLWADESSHSIYLNPGETREQLEKLVKERMKAAGAKFWNKN